MNAGAAPPMCRSMLSSSPVPWPRFSNPTILVGNTFPAQSLFRWPYLRQDQSASLALTAPSPRSRRRGNIKSCLALMSAGQTTILSGGLWLRLSSYWAGRGCAVLQPYDMEVGAGTFHPATTLRALGPNPWAAAYVQPSRRPTDGRYGENPNRLQHYYQFQVIIKPSPPDLQDLYLGSLRAIGIDMDLHDIRFVEDDWESPTLGAWGLGWEVWWRRDGGQPVHLLPAGRRARLQAGLGRTDLWARAFGDVCPGCRSRYGYAVQCSGCAHPAELRRCLPPDRAGIFALELRCGGHRPGCSATSRKPRPSAHGFSRNPRLIRSVPITSRSSWPIQPMISASRRAIYSTCSTRAEVISVTERQAYIGRGPHAGQSLRGRLRHHTGGERLMGRFASGSTVVTGLIGFAVLFGLAFWWFQQHAFYEETAADSVEIAGEVYPVTQWRGVRSDSSPLKLRACFLLQEEIQAPPAFEAAPLVGPGWFQMLQRRDHRQGIGNRLRQGLCGRAQRSGGFRPDRHDLPWRARLYVASTRRTRDCEAD